MTNPTLSAAIAKKRADLAKLDRQRDILAGELRGLEEAAKMLEAVDQRAANPLGVSGRTVVFDANLVVAASRQPGISTEWRPVLAALSAVGDTFNYTDMLLAAERLSLPLRAASARAKAMGWRQAGLIEAIKPGQFRLTERGRSVAQPAVQELFQ